MSETGIEMFVSAASSRRTDLLDTQAGYRSGDHQLLDLARALEDRVVQIPGIFQVRFVFHSDPDQARRDGW